MVFGHLIEPMRYGDAAGFLYTVIYVFHMPAFVFLTGYFAKFSWRRIGALALCYAVFQTVYLLVDWGIAGVPAGELNLQYLTPDWVMWYLLATIVWLFLVPLLKTSNRVRMGITFSVSVAIALVAGLCDGIGYFLSLSRICAFLPFFVAGYYARQLAKGREGESEGEQASSMGKSIRRLLFALGMVCAVATCVVVAICDINPVALYNSLPYSATGAGLLQRAAMMLLAAGWICLLFAVVPDKRLRAITNAGAHTMPIYLLHGLLVRVLRSFGGLPFGEIGGIAVAFVLAMAITFAFGNRICDKIVRFGL